jgi:hypothetical protein
MALTVPGSFAAIMPAVVERSLENASFEGARMVMPDAEARADASAGCPARRPMHVSMRMQETKRNNLGFIEPQDTYCSACSMSYSEQ